jgi:uncharacterized delta-60 repeat protein
MQVVRRVSVRRVSEYASAVARRAPEDLRYPVVFELLERRLLRDSDPLLLELETSATEAVDGGSGPTAPAVGPSIDPFERLDLGGVESAMSVAVQADGKVVTFGFGGWLFPNSSEQVATHVIVARYNVDGTLDASFGTQGGYRVIDAPSTSASYGSEVRIAADGSIWASTGAARGWLLKISPDGRSHQVVTEVRASQFALQADGKVVYAGYEIGRLNADGSRDTTFGVNGVLPQPSEMLVEDVAVDAQGRIVLAGYRHDASTIDDQPASTGKIIRLNADGTLDTSFANGGVFLLGLLGRRHETFLSVLVRNDGTIVAGGELFKQWRNPEPSEWPYQSASGALTVRLNDDGTLDDSYGNGGVRWWTEDGGRISVIYDLAETLDGRLAGAVYTGRTPAIAVLEEDGGAATLMRGVEPNANFYIKTTDVAIAPDGSVVTAAHVSIQDAWFHRAEGFAVADMIVTRFTLAPNGTPTPVPPMDLPREVIAPPVAPPEEPVEEPEQTETPGVPPAASPQSPDQPTHVPTGGDSPFGAGATNDVLFGGRDGTLFGDFNKLGDDRLLGDEDDEDDVLNALMQPEIL